MSTTTLSPAAVPPSPTSARSPSCAPAGWPAGSPQLYVGLVLYGVSLAMMVRAEPRPGAVGRAALGPGQAPAAQLGEVIW